MDRNNFRIKLGICLFLILVTGAVYWQTFSHGFLNYDDDTYVTQNPYVNKGVSMKSVVWAFSSFSNANWHPLTWISHMLDCQLFGLNPGPHHLVNVLFHIVNSVLLYLVLLRMSDAPFKSAFVAALFALHPLHVESVAWIAERKDVLSTFFWMLTMWFYVRYVERPAVIRYGLVIVFFAFGLMSKPMVVTLPFVLLLLDYWPLGRFPINGRNFVNTTKYHGAGISQLILEKVPLLFLSAVASVVTYVAQKKGAAIVPIASTHLETRIANAIISYLAYLRKMIFPYDLAVIYPYPKGVSGWDTVWAASLLIAVSIFVLAHIRRRPFLIVGWLWFLGTLVPVIGLVQVGAQALADRYTYVPLIGIFIMISWGIPSFVPDWKPKRSILAISAGCALVLMATYTVIQIGFWKNSGTLFSHAISINSDNAIAHNNLGTYLMDNGRFHEAGTHFLKVLRLEPGNGEAHSNLGMALVKQGNPGVAISHFKKALLIDSHNAELCNNMGNALASTGNLEAAMAYYRRAIQIRPNYADAHNNLGIILAMQGNLGEAIVHFKKASSLKPGAIEIENNLKRARIEKYRRDNAISH